MVDTKASAFTAKATPLSTDKVPIISDPGGTPANALVTLSNLHKALATVSATSKGLVPQSNLAATTAPAATDDSASGYATGSLWLDTTNGKAYICITAGVGAADWNQIDAAGTAANFSTIKYASIVEKTASYVIVNGDKGKLLVFNSATAINADLDATSWAAGEFVDVLNIGDGDVTVRAGAATPWDEGINRAGNDSFTLVKDQRIRVIYNSATDPKWRAQYETFVTTGNYQFDGSDGSAAPFAYDLKGSITGSIEATANGTKYLAFKTPFALTIDDVDLATIAGTVSAQIDDDGTAITGFGTAVALTTTNTNTVSGAAIAKGSEITLVLTSASSLTGVKFALNYTRTGN